jgi:hypothetical protein
MTGCGFHGMYPAMPDLGDVYIARNVLIEADPADRKAIVAFLNQGGEAVAHGDVDAVMALYALEYKHHGVTTAALRTEWRQRFEMYARLSLTNVVSELRVDGKGTPRTAQIVCSGALWGTSKQSGKRESIDTWFDEVLYLVEDNGKWLSQGHAWEGFMDKESRFAHAPHPFF